MSEKALAEGVAAYKCGRKRAENPYDASVEDWMCWRDGWEQAKAAASRLPPAETTIEPRIAP